MSYSRKERQLRQKEKEADVPAKEVFEEFSVRKDAYAPKFEDIEKIFSAEKMGIAA